MVKNNLKWILIIFFLKFSIRSQLNLNIDSTKFCSGYFYSNINCFNKNTTNFVGNNNILNCPVTFNRPTFSFINYLTQNITDLTMLKSQCYSTSLTNSTDQLVLENNNYSYVFFHNSISNNNFATKDDFIKNIFVKQYSSNKGISIFTSNNRYYIFNNNLVNINFLDQLTTSNNCENLNITDSSTNNNIFWSNCIDSGLGIPNDSWFKNNIRYNFALWFAVVLLLLYFVWTLMIEETLPLKKDYKNKNITFHPIVSISVVGSDVFTRNSRITSLFTSLVSSMFLISLMNFIFKDDKILTYAAQVPIFAIIGIIFSFFFNYINGYFLLKIKDVHEYFIQNVSKCFSYKVRKNLEEQYTNKLSLKNFIFYFFNLVIFLTFNSLSVYFINYKTRIVTISSIYWLIEVLSAWLFDIFVLDFIIVMLTKFSFFKKIFKYRGFFYDYNLQKKYNAVDFQND